MKFPEEYIRRGEFILHSGQKSDIFYDVNSLITNSYWCNHILSVIPFFEHYVGIATGGAIIAALLRERVNSKYSMIKDGELKGGLPKNYILIDDVITTGKSLEEALKIINKKPKKIWVVLDRRKENENPFVHSLFEI